MNKSGKNFQFFIAYGLSFLFWFSLSLIFAADRFLDYRTAGLIEVSFFVEFGWQISNWMPWFFLVPLIFYLSRRLPMSKNNRLRSILLILFFSIVVTVVKIAIYYLFSLPLRTNITPTFFYTQLFDVLMGNFIGNVLIYWCIVFYSYAYDYYQKARQRELETSQLETRLAQAELQVLKMQLHPHFLFNTLNSISALIHKDVDLADKMITQLSDLLRITLDSTGVQEVPLAEEIKILKNYLSIEKIRFQERLEIEYNIDHGIGNALVPNLLLQPIAENCIKHAIAPFSREGKIVIEAKQKNKHILIRIYDNGPGVNNDIKMENKGLGLSNTRARLKQMYRDNHKFVITNHDTEGAVVEIELPLKVDK